MDHSTPSAKRTRHRKNQKNIPAGAWNYIDWEIRKFEEEGIDWEVWVNGELVDPQKVRKRTKEEVPLTLQTLRNHASTRPPAPERPFGCCVFEKRFPAAVTKLECGSDMDIDNDLDGQASSASNTPAIGTPFLITDIVPCRDLSGPFRDRRGTHPRFLRIFGNDTQDSGRSPAMPSVVLTATEFISGYQSPEGPVQRMKVAAPVVFTNSATAVIPKSHFGTVGSVGRTRSDESTFSDCSWDPENPLFRSESDCVYTESAAQPVRDIYIRRLAMIF